MYVWRFPKVRVPFFGEDLSIKDASIVVSILGLGAHL